MPSIKYLEIVDDMSLEAFKHCSNMLFNCFDYNVMKQDDFRKIDLKEQLLQFEKNKPHVDNKTKKDFSDFAYASDIAFYLKTYVKCAENSIAAGYKKKALNIVNRAKNGEADTADLTDLTFIYINLMRESFFALQKGKEREISNVDRALSKYDDYLLTQIREFDFKIPQGFVEKGIIQIAPTPIKKDAENMFTKYVSKDRKYSMYLISTLFYIRAMQNEGEYAED